MLATGGQNECGALWDPKAALGAGRKADPMLRERERSLRNLFLSGWVAHCRGKSQIPKHILLDFQVSKLLRELSRASHLKCRQKVKC